MTLATLMANMKQARRENSQSRIGGGIFPPEEMEIALFEIEALQNNKQRAIDRLEYLYGFKCRVTQADLKALLHILDPLRF